MQNLEEGQFVLINDDNWDTLNKHGKIIKVNEDSNSVVVLVDAVHMTISKNSVSPLNFLTEIENDGEDIL